MPSGLDLLEDVGKTNLAPKSNLPPFDIALQPGANPEEEAMKLATPKSGLDLLALEEKEVVESTKPVPEDNESILSTIANFFTGEPTYTPAPEGTKPASPTTMYNEYGTPTEYAGAGPIMVASRPESLPTEPPKLEAPKTELQTAQGAGKLAKDVLANKYPSAKNSYLLQTARMFDLPEKLPPDLGKVITSGYARSVGGTRARAGGGNFPTLTPEEYGKLGAFGQFAHSLITFGFDLPVYMVGGMIGSAAGPPGAVGGAFGFAEGLRSYYDQQLEKGEVTGPRDFLDRALKTGLETLKGIATGKVMEKAGALGKATGVPFAKTIAEASALATVPAALEARFPTKEEYYDAASFLLGLNVITRGPKAIGKMREIFRKTGRLPSELKKDVETDPKLADVLTNEEDKVPEDVIQRAKEKVAETAKVQADLEAAKELAKKRPTAEELVTEELKEKGKKVRKAKGKKVEEEVVEEPVKEEREEELLDERDVYLELRTLGYSDKDIKGMAKGQKELIVDQGIKKGWKSEEELAKEKEEGKVKKRRGKKAAEVVKVEEPKVEEPTTKVKKPRKRIKPDPITPIDEDLGESPAELKGADHPFRDKDPEHTKVMSDLYRDKVKNASATPELYVRYLINGVNRYLNGEEVPIEKIRDGLSELATRSEELRGKFVKRVDFENFRETAEEAAKWARTTDRLNVKRTRGPSEVQLNMMIPVDQLPKMVKDVMKGIKAGTARFGNLYRNREVWEKTGFWLGKDGKWRYEIDDNKLSIDLTPLTNKGQYGGGTNITNIIRNFELFKDVPELEKVRVDIIPELKDKGDYNPSTKVIRVGKADKSTVIHELQHAVNDIVGSKFRGSNVEVERNKIDMALLDELKRAAKTDEIKAIIQAMIEDDYINYRGSSNLAATSLINRIRKSNIVNDEVKIVAEKYRNLSAFENYMKDPGEMEARLASIRMEMTPEQRKAEPPWETLETMLIRENISTPSFRDGLRVASGKSVDTLSKTGSTLYSGIDPTQIPEATKKIIAGAKRLAAYTAEARGMKAFKPRDAADTAMRELIRSGVDRSGNIRRDLLDKLGDEGYRIIQAMYLSKGASSLAVQQLKQMRKEVYGGLDKNDRRILDNLILADRMLDIGKYKTAKEFKFPEGLTPTEAAAYNELFQFTEKITPEKAAELQQRAKSYFEWMKKPLKDMLEAELITQEEYDALASHNYRRLKLVDIFDRRYQAKIGKKSRTVYDSGVEALARGRETDVFEPSSEIMALEVFNRAYGRILNNAANRTLLDLARNDKENPFVRIKDEKGKKIPTGWNRIYVYEKGERQALYLSPEMSKEWITNNPEMSYKMSQIIRYASGSPVLRTFATGIDWGFALANLPRDVMHAWFATRVFNGKNWESAYSPHLPVFGMQMLHDQLSVFTDVLLRRGVYEDYIKEGGGMEFLVHQGRLLQRGRHIEGRLDKLQDFLGYLGETTELMTRASIRNRVIRKRANELGISFDEAYRNEKIRTEATFAARDYMDFGQGGGVGKALDNGIPYLNASIQGTRGLFRSARDNPMEFTYKLAQFATVVSGLYIANQAINPDTMKDLKGSIDMQNNLCIPLGDKLGFVDEKGQMRYIYFKIPIDPGQKFFKSLFEAGTDKWLGNEVDTEAIANTFTQISPVGISSLPPTISGTLGYMVNKDFWKDEEIWKKTEQPSSWQLPKMLTGEQIGGSEEEFIPGRTPQMYTDLGKVTGLSPERAKYAIEQLITSGSMWGWMVGQGYEKVLGELPQDKREMHIAEALTKIPVIRRFIGITDPYAKFAQPIKETKEEGMFERWTQNRGLDAKVEGYLYQGNVERSEITDYIKSFKDKDIQDRLKDRFEFSVNIKELPNRSFWLSLKGVQDVDARAKLLNDRMRGSNDEQRAQLYREIATVEKAGGIISEDFKKAFMKYRSESVQ